MTRFFVLFIFLAMLLPQFAAAAVFPDMENTWFQYRDAVDALKERGVIAGYPDGTFRPEQPINRAEFLKLVFKGRSRVEPVGRRCFSDVNPDAWYAPYVCTAARRGIVDGYPDGTFQADQTVNTAEAIKILLNAYERDVHQSSGEQWYQPYVDFLDNNDILADHSYLPWKPLNRVRAADLIWRMLRFEEERDIPRYSDGCGKAKPNEAADIYVAGERRSYLLTMPNSYVVHDPVPLLIAFHGRTNGNDDVRRYYGFDHAADEAIVAYPSARTNGNGTFLYEDEEVQFFDDLVRTLAKRYCIDMNRIYVAGHSLGGWFANKIACIRGDVIRASASVGSSGFIGKCSGPAAAMILHNPEDRLAPFSGSETIREERVETNGCSWETEATGPQDYECQQHNQCSGNAVTFCPHTISEDYRGEYYPHTWPGNAGQHIWNFFTNLP